MEKKTDIIETPLKSSGNVSENSKENLSEKEQPANLKYNSDFSCSEPDTEDKNIHTAEEYTYKSRKERNGMGKRKKDGPPKKGFKIIHIIIPVACIAVILGVFLSLPLFLPKNAIASNLYSADIKLGGLTVSEAQNKLADSYKAKDING